MDIKKGKVTLVGAGPGDANLLTIKGLTAIKNADVILYDRLLGEDIFNFFPKDVQKIDVGKSAGNHPVTQNQINELLLKYALDGKKVVRLKGGDSFIFGRGSEELELIIENKIDFEVIPGVPSFIGSACYAGISITKRGVASSFHVYTGHFKDGEAPKFDFKQMAKTEGTLIFMMSLSSCEKISNGLLREGVSAYKPVAIIENGTMKNQRYIRTTLGLLTQTVNDNNIKSPATIIVGDVCNYKESLDWFSLLPLKNKKILVTRPEQTTGKLYSKLKELGADTILYPCINKKPIDFSLDLNAYKTLVFTSSFGVERFFEKLFSLGKDTRSLYAHTICTVGIETAETLKKYGVVADFFPDTYDGLNLAKGIISNEFYKNGLIAIFRAKDGAKELTDTLSKENIQYEDIGTYTTEHTAFNKMDVKFDLVTFTSASCVKAFINANPQIDFTKVKCVCIGETTKAEAEKVNMQIFVSEKATIDFMIYKILEVCKNDC